MTRHPWILALTALLAAGLAAGPAVRADDDDDDDDGYSRGRSYRYGSRYYAEEPIYRRYRHYRYHYRPRYAAYRHRCGDCGQRFASSYWLTYHRRHTDCY
jgi:hypothetical protein